VADPIACCAVILVEPGKKKPYKNKSLKGNLKPIKENQMTQMTEQEFFEIWQTQNTVVSEIEYRLYYDDQGFPLFYSVDPVPGLFVIVDKQTYLDSPKHVRVINGKLRIVKTVYGKKLVPSQQGQACDSRDVCVISVDLDQLSTKWAIKHEEPIDEPY
jgi:hypothetical protein